MIAQLSRDKNKTENRKEFRFHKSNLLFPFFPFFGVFKNSKAVVEHFRPQYKTDFYNWRKSGNDAMWTDADAVETMLIVFMPKDINLIFEEVLNRSQKNCGSDRSPRINLKYLIKLDS